MPYSFLHTADWQLGKPFGEFDSEAQALLRRARIDAIKRLAEAARAAKLRDILVAGDVFDAENPETTLLREVSAKLGSYSDLVWHLLPGNHDPARPGAVWDRLRALRPAANIIVHDKPAPYEPAPGVVILPAPLTAKAMSTDPTSWMDHHETPAGSLRIGFAHGSVAEFDGDAAVEIDVSRVRSARLDYLALGDWHGAKCVNERVWYAGTPEPDRFKENGPGHALIVRIAGHDSPPVVEQVACAQFRWLERKIALSGPDDLHGLEEEIAALGEDSAETLLKVYLSGDLSLAALAAIEARLDDLEPRLFRLVRRTRDVNLVPQESDFSDYESGEAGAVIAKLKSQAGAADDAKAVVAARALRKLFVLLHRQEGGP